MLSCGQLGILPHPQSRTTFDKDVSNWNYTEYTHIEVRDVKTPKFFGPARSSFFRPGPARNKMFYFRPVWVSENILSSMFYNKTTNYLILTDLQRRRLDFGSREEHTAKNYSTETLKQFYIQIGIHNF